MRHRLRIILSIAGLLCNMVATALAAAAIYVNQTTATTLATTTWARMTTADGACTRRSVCRLAKFDGRD
jgi:hypothetical protein